MNLETWQHLHTIELPTPYPVGPITVYLCDAPGEPVTLVDTGPHTGKTQAALEAGGMDEGAPGPRPDYGDAYYGCFVRDPDGNKIEAHVW